MIVRMRTRTSIEESDFKLYFQFPVQVKCTFVWLFVINLLQQVEVLEATVSS